MEIELCAFIDESYKPVRDLRTGRVSRRGRHYLVAAAVVFDADADQVRAKLLAIEAHLGYQIHWADLGRTRKLEVMEALDGIADWDAYIYETDRPYPERGHSEHHLRAKVLRAAFDHLGHDVGIRNVVLETRSAPKIGFTELDLRDGRLLQSQQSKKEAPADMRLEHRDKGEALLWVADVIAGSRSDHLCLKDLDVYPRLGHRVQTIKAVG